MVRHRLLHFAVGIEPEVGDPLHQLYIAGIARPPGELGEHDVAGEHQGVGSRQAVLRAIDVGFRQPFDLFEMTQPQLADERHGLDVPGLVEIASVVLRQLLCQLSRRAGAAPVELGVGFRARWRADNRTEQPWLGGRVARGNPADFGDALLRERRGQSHLVAADHDHQIRAMDP